MFFNIGDYIEFKNEFWDAEGKHFYKKVKAKVLGFIHDPLKIKKSKYLVNYNQNKLGVPCDEVLNIQLKINFNETINYKR
jgi:hypothetical protein